MINAAAPTGPGGFKLSQQPEQDASSIREVASIATPEPKKKVEHTPESHKPKTLYIGLLVFAVLLMGFSGVMYLATKNQDNRQQAYEPVRPVTPSIDPQFQRSAVTPVTSPFVTVVDSPSPSTVLLALGTSNPYLVSVIPSPIPFDTPSPSLTPFTSDTPVVATYSSRTKRVFSGKKLPVSGSIGWTIVLIAGGAFSIIAGTYSIVAKHNA